MFNLINSFMQPRASFAIFLFLVAIFYVIAPCIIFFLDQVSFSFIYLSIISFLGLVFVYLGSKIRTFDFLFGFRRERIYIHPMFFVLIVWAVFCLYVGYVFYTAQNIPILSAIKGASDAVVSEQRGAFLKGRTGIDSSLIYIGTILSSTIVPYSIIVMYRNNMRGRSVACCIFLAYCISFMAKTMFLSLVLPLLAYKGMTGSLRLRWFVFFVVVSFLIIFISIYITSSSGDFYIGLFNEGFFSSGYLPKSASDYMFWRALAVPIFTATDSLNIFYEHFDGKYFLGATSSFFSLLFGLARVNFERYVFMYQFGAWNDTANSNSFYIIDAYVNFSLLGIIFYSIIVGWFLRAFKLSNDYAFSSLWLLFIYQLFSASLVGTMLSNGFFIILIISLMFKIGR